MIAFLFVLFGLLANTYAEESLGQVLRQLEANTLSIKEIVERQQNHVSLTQRDQSTLQHLSSELDALKKLTGTPDILLEKASLTLEKVSESQGALNRLKEKIENQESTIGGLSGTVKNFPIKQAESTQAVTELKKATEEYASELRKLKEDFKEFISKNGVKNLESTLQQLHSKLENTNKQGEEIGNKLDDYLARVSTEKTASAAKEKSFETYGKQLESIVATQTKIFNKLTEESQGKAKLETILENQNKILKLLNQGVLDQVTQFFSKVAEFVKGLWAQASKELPKIQKDLTKWWQKNSKKLNLPTETQVQAFLETNIFKPLTPLLVKANIPKEFHVYAHGTVLGIGALLVGILTYLIIGYFICKPLCWLCCGSKKSKKNPKVEGEEEKDESGDKTAKPSQQSKRQPKKNQQK
jgi:uncharacterized protein YukE